MNETLRLIVDHYNKVPTGKFSYKDQAKSIQQALVEANLGETKITPRTIREGKCNGLFTLLEEAINLTVLEGLPDDNPLFQYVEMRNVAKGDSPIFKVKKKSLYTVANIATGTQALNRQRLTNEQTIEVKTQPKGIKIYEELSRVMTGAADFNELISTVSESFQKYINQAMYSAVTSALAGLAAPYNQSGSYSEDVLLKIIDHVEAATGRTAIVLGSKQAVRKIKDVSGNDSELAKSDRYKLGYYGHIGENAIVSMKNAHKPNSTEFILPDDKLYVIASDSKFLKFVTEGETYIITGDQTKNADLTQDFLMMEQFGVAAVFEDNGFGIYNLEG